MIGAWLQSGNVWSWVTGSWGIQDPVAENYVLFSPLWYKLKSAIIQSTLVITPLTPYVITPVLYVFQKAKCSKDTKPDKGEFLIIKKTVYFLSTILLIFATGFGRIDFFFYGVISFFVQYFMDKIFITYWYRPKAILSDPTNGTTLSILKYAPAIYLMMGFFIFRENQCPISNELIQDITYANQPQKCQPALPILLFIIYATAYPLLVIATDMSSQMFPKGLDLLYKPETDYFSLISKTQRKRWIIEETYRR